jgi:hypothetical protein
MKRLLGVRIIGRHLGLNCIDVYYEVDYGPVTVRDGKLAVSELPVDASFPLECSVTAYQIGRRTEPSVPPAPPVTQTFRIIAP